MPVNCRLETKGMCMYFIFPSEHEAAEWDFFFRHQLQCRLACYGGYLNAWELDM